MAIDERLRTEEGLEPVSEMEVMRYWLREELDAADGDELDPDAVETDPTLRQELFERKPIAERVFAPETADWYRGELSEAELRSLRVVVGPHDQDWRAVTEDNRIESIAERIHEADPERLDDELPKDIDEVVEMAEAIAPEGPESRLIVVKEGEAPAYVADGNHRAVAHVLYLLRGGEFAGQETYLGVRE